MHDHYSKKIDRVTAILTQLQSKPLVRAQTLAEKFNVSIRTIYRDIKTLENAGIPIIGEAGNGYSLMEGYKIPPIMFTKEEVLSFITAEKLMKKFAHESLDVHYHSAMEKVKSVLRTSDKKFIQNIENQINIYSYKPKSTDLVRNSIPTILESIDEKLQLTISYKKDNGEISERNIEAVGIFFEFNYWYVMAYCILRKDFRQFRIDRFQKIGKTELPFLQNYGNIEQYRKNSKNPKTEVKILVNRNVLPHITNSKKYYGLTHEEEKENRILMTFETEWIADGFPRWLITFADYIEILEPEFLKETMKNLVTSIAENLNKEPL